MPFVAVIAETSPALAQWHAYLESVFIGMVSHFRTLATKSVQKLSTTQFQKYLHADHGHFRHARVDGCDHRCCIHQRCEQDRFGSGHMRAVPQFTRRVHANMYEIAHCT